MNEPSSPNVNLSVRDHIKLIKAMIEDEAFQERMLADPAAALAEYVPEFTQEELDALPNEGVEIPTVDVLEKLLRGLREADRMSEFPFRVENWMCGPRPPGPPTQG